jgi:hypothetical protein
MIRIHPFSCAAQLKPPVFNSYIVETRIYPRAPPDQPNDLPDLAAESGATAD